MTKKTRRILPKGQRPVSGSVAGMISHPADCGCRPCRRLRTRGARRTVEQTAPADPPAPTDQD